MSDLAKLKIFFPEIEERPMAENRNGESMLEKLCVDIAQALRLSEEKQFENCVSGVSETAWGPVEKHVHLGFDTLTVTC